MGEVKETAGASVEYPNHVRAFVDQEVRAIDTEAREITHLISTSVVDRQGDIVEADGVDLTHYKRNPVVTVDHAYSVEKVVGRGAVKVDGDRLIATTQFRDTPLAMDAFRLASEGLGGWSIGFRPKSAHTIKDGASAECKQCVAIFNRASRGKKPGDRVPGMYGMHFLEWELLEYSIVAIPANQEIVNNAVTRGLVTADHTRSFFLDSETDPEPATAAPDGATVPAKSDARVHPALLEIVRRTERRLAAHALRRYAAELTEK